mgnify:CR=1 FL=1
MTRYVELMTCPKRESVLLGIIGGLGNTFGIKPELLRLIFGAILIANFVLGTNAFWFFIIFYFVSFFLIPRYEEMYDRAINPDAQPPEF